MVLGQLGRFRNPGLVVARQLNEPLCLPRREGRILTTHANNLCALLFQARGAAIPLYTAPGQDDIDGGRNHDRHHQPAARLSYH